MIISPALVTLLLTACALSQGQHSGCDVQIEYIFGTDGEPGLMGKDGRVGPQGLPGKHSDGSPGKLGDPGQAGEKGPQGAKGIDGLNGRRGQGGDTGDPGPAGPEGPIGVKGQKGEPGSVLIFRPSHDRPNRGRKGDDGEPGLFGQQGKVGDMGTPGEPGPAGAKGEPNNKVGQRGPTGMPGEDGLDNSDAGGVVYTRWGKSTCRDGENVRLVYKGRVGGSTANHSAVNYLCMPEDPEYILGSGDTAIHGQGFIYGTKYGGSTVMPGRSFHDVPCVVCFVSARNTVFMIPSKVSCPNGWTREYNGYLMSGSVAAGDGGVYSCVDVSMDTVPESESDEPGGHLWHVEAGCTGVECPPYDGGKELGCVVCSK